MSNNAKPMEAEHYKAIKEYVKERDEVIEARDPEKFMDFIKKHKDLYEEGVYEKFVASRKAYGDDFIILTMAKMAKESTGVKATTKCWYHRWLKEWKNTHSDA